MDEEAVKTQKFEASEAGFEARYMPLLRTPLAGEYKRKERRAASSMNILCCGGRRIGTEIFFFSLWPWPPQWPEGVILIHFSFDVLMTPSRASSFSLQLSNTNNHPHMYVRYTEIS